MIQLVLAYNREVLSFLVKDKEIYYTDRKWKTWIRCLPPPKDLMRQIKNSRNRVPEVVASMFNFTEEEMAEYEKLQTEKELADVVVRDAKLKGCKVVKNQEVKQDDIR